MTKSTYLQQSRAKSPTMTSLIDSLNANKQKWLDIVLTMITAIPTMHSYAS